MLLEHNKQPISLRNGKVFLDGYEVMDAVKCDIKFTPETWAGKQLGDKTDSTRWLGYKIAGSITRRRSTPWLKEMVKEYIKTGRTPEFKIQGILDDPASDYGAQFGSDAVTVVGVVLTGDLQLISLDAGGDIFDETISFSAKDIV
ncbi:MAG: phage tail tube protein [Eubacterium sp.]|jgi:hypothetical protein|nr:phage tail tube protein [Eubacterium sp.]